jgi:PDZ domain
MTVRLHSIPCRWMPALLAACGLLLGSAGPTRAQPKNDDTGDLQKQIEKALEELKKIDPKEQPKNLDDFQRRLEVIQGQLRGIAPRNPQARRGGFGVSTVGSRFGAIVQVPPPVVIDQLDLPANKGLVVLEVQPDSPAEKAGIRKNDILIEFAGKLVPSDLIDFTNDVRDHKLGDEVDAVVLRRGKRETIKGIKLAEFRTGLDDRFDRFRPAFVPAQRIPDVRIEVPPAFANIPGVNGDMMRVHVDNDGFQVEMSNGTLKATLKGTRENNKMTPQEVRIHDGDSVVDVRDMTQVPERYRALVARMLASVGAAPVGGGARRE